MVILHDADRFESNVQRDLMQQSAGSSFVRRPAAWSVRACLLSVISRLWPLLFRFQFGVGCSLRAESNDLPQYWRYCKSALQRPVPRLQRIA